jgi:hypothetical protein
VPVIPLHGYSDWWHSRKLLLGRLPASFHAIRSPSAGTGDADRPAAGYRPEDHAADDWAAGITAAMNAPGGVRSAMSVARFG